MRGLGSESKLQAEDLRGSDIILVTDDLRDSEPKLVSEDLQGGGDTVRELVLVKENVGWGAVRVRGLVCVSEDCNVATSCPRADSDDRRPVVESCESKP